MEQRTGKETHNLRRKLLLQWGAVIGALALVLLAGTADVDAGTFNPELDVNVVDPTAEAPSNFVVDFNLPKGDVQFAGVVAYIPDSWGIARGETLPIGAVVGHLESQATLGIVGAACNTELPVKFDMLNASIDIEDTVSFDDTNKDDTDPTRDYAKDVHDSGTASGGSSNTLEDSDNADEGVILREWVANQWINHYVRIVRGTGSGQQATIESNTNNTLTVTEPWETPPDDTSEYEIFNGLYDSIDKYPDFINRVFDTDNLQPIRRSAGIAIVAGIPVLLQFLVFEPGTHINDDLDDDAALGYPSVTLLQNAGDPDANPQPSAITDFCTPLTSNNVSFGISEDNVKDTPDVDESGFPVNINPLDGVYTFTTVAAGQRDVDGDSYENSFDTCAFDTNVGNPRVTADGDLDQDGLDAACDPSDDPATGGTNSDEDGDGYSNRQDNCPLRANGEDATNQHDEDKDQIGDECDPNPDQADTEGKLLYTQPTKDITIGAGGAGGPPSAAACAGKGAYEGVDVCFRLGDPPGPGFIEPSSQQTSTPTGTGPTGTDETPEPTDGPSEDGGGSSAAFFIIIGVVAALAIVGGGGFFMMRRGGGAA